MNGPDIVPLRFELSTLVPRSVASLYSHLVTRPTGHALRLGIESQISELGAVCLSVLDFAQVLVLDYSCAEETVAKLILRFQREDRPADAYFIARGLHEHHLETLETVLTRQHLALVVQGEPAAALIGEVTADERAAWQALEELRSGGVQQVAERMTVPTPQAQQALDDLTARRVVLRYDVPRSYFSLSAILGA